ncbi:hypothetical protein AB0442_08450 [Kitasatospora sp. NPDC085895]|uniref:hypothetical protein n=1 Tax=Kitasatospora sp. NPDC085895 TaxID=3155057 RepID=UPI0034509E37
MGWEITAQGYSARLENGRVVHRNDRGRVLKKVPPPLVGHPGLLRLLALADGVAAHRRTCRQMAERLVQEAVAVPAHVVELLAADSAWKEAVAQAGLVPAAAGSPGQEGEDLLLARRYRHPALPDEERILLTTADAVRHRDELMVHLGWEPVDTRPTGLPGPGAVPFPESALAEHPARTDEVLHHVERLEQVTSAWQVFIKRDVDAVLKEIAGGRPALLRCFLDGVADQCLRHGGEPSDAAAWFGRARAAERSAGEHVDQQWLDARYAAVDAAGALTDTAFRERIKQVTARGADPEAARRVLALLGDRTVREGERPRLVADVVRTARAAGCDPDRELARLAARLLPARDLRSDAAREFWTALLAAPAWDLVLAELPGLAHEVVAAGPQPGMLGPDLALRYLERTGALALLTGPAGADGAAPGTAADWLRRLAGLADRSYHRVSGPGLLRLTEVLAPRIAADGVPVDLPYSGRRDRNRRTLGTVRLDVLDVLLAAGAPVADPPPLLGDPYLHHLAVAPRPGLHALTADPRFAREIRALLRAEFELTNGGDSNNLWYQPHDPKGWANVPGLVDTDLGRSTLAEWCDEELAELPVLDLDGLALMLARFMHVGAAAALLAATGRAERLAAVDVAGLLLAAVAGAAPGHGLDRAGAERLLQGVEASSVFRDGVALPVRRQIGRLLEIEEDEVGTEFARLVQIAANCRNGVAHLLPLLTPEAAATPGPAGDTDTSTATDVDTGAATGTRTGTGTVGSRAAARDRPAVVPARVRLGRLLHAAADGAPWNGDLDQPSAIVPGVTAAFPYLVVDPQTELLRGDTVTGTRLREYADLPFVAERGPGRWRTVSVTQPGRTPAPPVGHVYRTALSTAVVLHSTFNRSQLLEYAPSGTFPEDSALAAAGYRVETGHDLVPVADARWLHAYLELLAERGPLPARPDTVRELAQRLTLTADEAGALLAVRKHHRDHPTAAEKEIAGRIGYDALREIRSRLLPDDPERLWTHGPDLDRAVAGWYERFGTPPVGAGLMADAGRELRFPKGDWAPAGPGPEVDPGPAGLRRRRRQLDALLAAALAPASGPDRAPAPYASPCAMAWLAYRTPVGHPLRPALAEAALRTAAEASAGGGAAAWRVFSADRRAAVGEPPSPLALAGLTGVEVVDDPARRQWHVLVRPELLDGADDPVLDALDDYYDRLQPSQALPSGSGLPALTDLRILLSGDLDTLGRHLAADADRTPGWEQDPRRSAPEVVAACAAALGVTADAAALHLMLLTLPDPTDRRVRRWTGWSPAALKAAQQQVRGTGLVVEARRSRAGRSLFLPGPWLELKVPRLPVEAGKRALLPADPTRASGVHTAVVPSRPLPVLFADAWRSADPAKEEPGHVR